MDQKTKLNIIKEAKRIEEDSLHTEKSHFEAAALWERVYFWIGVINAGLAALAGASILSEKFPVFGGALALLTSMLTALMTFSNPNKKAVSHLNAGNYYNGLRNNTRNFREINLNLLKSDEQIMIQLKQLIDERNRLNQSSPSIPRWAYVRGKQGIERGEADHKVDSSSKKNEGN